MHLEDISKEQIFLLASILHKPVSEAYLRYANRVYSVEPQLDHTLLRPDFLRRLVQLPQSRYASLCDLHKILNAKVVHEIFVLIATEVGIRLNSVVVAGRDKVGRETWDCSVLNLRALHGAWLHPEVFWDTFGQTLDVPRDGFSNEDYMTKWMSEEIKCEACILSRIGGDLETVFDLQMAVQSRTRTKSVRKYHEPRLIKVIEGWLRMWELKYPANLWMAKLEWNRLRAARLKEVRKSAANEKRRRRRSNREGRTGESKHRKQSKVSAPIIDHTPQRSDNDRVSGWLATAYPRPEDTIKVHPSSSTSNHKAEPEIVTSDDDDDGVGVSATIKDAEHDLIHCYAALISTPFLPGMDKTEHQRRASMLSRHSTTTINQVDDPSRATGQDDREGPKVARSQTTRHPRSSNYSESVYSQNFGGHPTTAHDIRGRNEESTSSLRRSKTVQEKRSTDKSWVTASVAPSVATSQASVRKGDRSKRTRKHEHGFDPIVEESSTPRQSSGGFAHRSISPIREADHRRKGGKYSRTDRGGKDSPVSPLSANFPSSFTAQLSFNDSQRHDSQRRDLRDERSKSHRRNAQPSTIVSTPSKSRSNDCRNSHGPSISSRLSRPFDAPAAEPGSMLNSARQVRDRDTVATDTTRWSALFGQEAEKIMGIERKFQGLNPRYGSRSSREGKGK